MNRMIMGMMAVVLIAAGAAQADDNALGFYFSDSEFTRETASGESSPGFAQTAYIVLTNATGTVVSGYEVGISATSADFSVILTNHAWGENSGTAENQIVTFHTPVPVDPAGTVLTFVIFSAESTEYTEISFGPSEPSSLPGTATVTFTDVGLVAAGYPFDGPVVAWLNEDPVAAEAQSLSGVKSLFQ